MAQVVQQVPSSFAVLCGDDSISIPLIALGGHGVVSVVSNEIPRQFTELIQRALRNDFSGARELQRKYLPLMEVNFVESNPIPVKQAMALMGLLEPVWRLPLCPPSPANLARIEKVVEALGLMAGRSVHAG
jgi:4-hydroxy-tetrahydrodipicolinate synthase